MAALRRAADVARPVALAGEHVLPVLPPLEQLLPDGGLRRGTVVAVDAVRSQPAVPGPSSPMRPLVPGRRAGSGSPPGTPLGTPPPAGGVPAAGRRGGPHAGAAGDPPVVRTSGTAAVGATGDQHVGAAGDPPVGRAPGTAAVGATGEAHAGAAGDPPVVRASGTAAAGAAGDPHAWAPGAAAGGATTLALALAAGASAAGSWTAVVGAPSLGLLAAAELGVALERVAVVPEVAPDAWAPVVAALADAVDVVLLHVGRRVRLGDARRLAARARERGSVLVLLPGGGGSGPVAWPDGVDVRLVVTSASWDGIDEGAGHLRARRVEIEAGGRRAAARPRRATLWLPGPDGAVAAVESIADPVPLLPAAARRVG
jgi:hypothetical protein